MKEKHLEHTALRFWREFSEDEKLRCKIALFPYWMMEKMEDQHGAFYVTPFDRHSIFCRLMDLSNKDLSIQ